MKSALIVILAGFLCLPVFAYQATAPPAITNADVVNMVISGVPESTILAAIKYGKTDFDTSLAAIISLKEQNVPSLTVEAMVRSNGDEAAGGAGTDKSNSPNAGPADSSAPRSTRRGHLL